MVNDKKTKNDYLNDIYRIIGTTPTGVFYDLKMTSAERGVLLRAAGLWDDAHHRRRKLKDWTAADRRRISLAADKMVENCKRMAAGLRGDL